MTTGTRDDVRIPISDEPEDRDLGWLYQIIVEPDPRRTSKPLIQKVAKTLSGISSNKTCFVPSVVSFGPYHNGKPHLEPMERYKEVAARWFIKLFDNRNRVNAITRKEAEHVYDKFVAKVNEIVAEEGSVSSLRDCYSDKIVDTINDADFMRMMFLDGCFMLYFIRLFLDKSGDRLETCHLNRTLILRDMFLLENQIPYSVLVALGGLKPSTIVLGDGWAASFFKAVLLPPHSSFVSISNLMLLMSMILFCSLLPVVLFLMAMLFLFCRRAVKRLVCCFLDLICCSWFSADSRSGEDTKLLTKPLHLLDLLRFELTGNGVDPPFHGTSNWNYNFRPISELKAAGILVNASDSESLSLNNIKFKPGWIDSYLELPRIIIDDSTKTRLLNLAAYEMCPDGSLGQAVTSYICFLDSLIYNADDVKELRSSNIMLNRLGSDEEVVNLFRELATNLSPDYKAYENVISGMEQHFKRDFKVLRMWIGQFIRIHFTSPWTAISLTAASFAILLTLVQTIYSILSFYKIE